MYIYYNDENIEGKRSFLILIRKLVSIFNPFPEPDFIRLMSFSELRA